jgi:hypothetical protein
LFENEASPQSISYLIVPLAVTGTRVSVIVEPEPAAAGLAVNVTLLTKVLARTLSTISFKSSIASVTYVAAVHDVYAPTLLKLPSVGVPNVIVFAAAKPPALFAAKKAALA